VLLIDECHLMWGDAIGYVWGRTDAEITVPVVNERNKQTYYGAIDYIEGKLLLKAYDKGNSENTIDYLQYLISTETEIITQPFKKILRLRQISPIEGCVIIYSHPLNRVS
jgi:hypothetical protein